MREYYFKILRILLIYMKLFEYIFYRFYILFYPSQSAWRAAMFAMLLLSVSVYIYLVSIYTLVASMGWVRFVSLFVNSSYDFSILLVGLMVQLLVYQVLVSENRHKKIYHSFRKNKPSRFLRVAFFAYLLLGIASLIAFVVILEYTSRLG